MKTSYYKHNHDYIRKLLRDTEFDENDIKNSISKNLRGKEISLRETAQLIKIDPSRHTELHHYITSAAAYVFKKRFGNRLNLVVPLYISNYCRNMCPYCGYSVNKNQAKKRSRLSSKALAAEIEYLSEMGFKNIELALGDDPKFTQNEISSYMKTVKEILDAKYADRFVGVNTQPYADYSLLSESNIDFVISWQETYHPQTYRNLHSKCLSKSDYAYRIQTQDRVSNSGIKTAGLGALLGLYDFRYEILSMIMHARYLIKRYAKLNLIFGIPRLKKASVNFQINRNYQFTDEHLMLIVSIIRLAMPSELIFISTREEKSLMFKLLKAGGGPIVASLCSVSPGYVSRDTGKNLSQFDVHSYRPQIIIEEAYRHGFVADFSKPLLK